MKSALAAGYARAFALCAMTDGKAEFNGKCTMCYRCFSRCPQKAITILGKRVYVQNKYEDYGDIL